MPGDTGPTGPKGDATGSLFAFPHRVDLSVNKAHIDNVQSDRPVMTTQTGTNLAGAYNGGGLGNKGILGISGFNGLPLGDLASFDLLWKNLTIDVPDALFYVNFVVEITPGVYKIIVLDVDATTNSPLVVTPLPDNQFQAAWTSSRFVKVVNFIPPVVPVIPSPSWPSAYYLLSDIIATFPAAKLVDASSLDGGLPNTTITPAVLLLLGDSNNVKAYSKLITSIRLNGAAI